MRSKLDTLRIINTKDTTFLKGKDEDHFVITLADLKQKYGPYFFDFSYSTWKPVTETYGLQSEWTGMVAEAKYFNTMRDRNNFETFVYTVYLPHKKRETYLYVIVR